MIVLSHPVGDGSPSFGEVAIFVNPDVLSLQAALEPLDVAASLRMMIRRTAVRNAQLRQGGDKALRGELGSVVGGQGQACAAAALGKTRLHDPVWTSSDVQEPESANL